MAEPHRSPSASDLTSRLSSVLDDVADGARSGALSGDEVVALATQLSRLESAVGVAASSFCGRGGHRHEGARSGSTWLALRARCSRRRASSLLRSGTVASALPRFGAAWASGAVSGDQLGLLHGHLTSSRTRDRLVDDEELLCELAVSLSCSEFVRALTYWAQLADPEGSSEAAEARRARRDVTLTPSYEGTVYGRLVLDPVSGQIVVSELARLETELWEEDWRQAHERLGRDPEPCELARTSAQRRADALVAMAERSALVGDTPIASRPLLTVLVDPPTLFDRICETEDGIVLHPTDLDTLWPSALFERALFETPDRVQISERTRLFRGATRRGVEVRDRRCTHPLCEEPASRCQVDHVVPYAEGGLTTPENGRLLCGPHNRQRNVTEGVPGRGWRGPDGTPPMAPGNRGGGGGSGGGSGGGGEGGGGGGSPPEVGPAG
jgi:uncharacterized membrane protein YgcG